MTGLLDQCFEKQVDHLQGRRSEKRDTSAYISMTEKVVLLKEQMLRDVMVCCYKGDVDLAPTECDLIQ